MKPFFLLSVLFHLFLYSCESSTDNNFKNSLSAEQQNSIKQAWKSEGLIDSYLSGFIGKDVNDLDEFYLYSNSSTDDNIDVNYGDFVNFTPENEFHSNYSAPCGNDCFPFANGTYEFVDEDKVRLYLINYGQSGSCKEKNVKANKSIGTFTITKDAEGGFKFVKN